MNPAHALESYDHAQGGIIARRLVKSLAGLRAGYTWATPLPTV